MLRRWILLLVLLGSAACGGDDTASSPKSVLPSPDVKESATAVASGVASDAAQQTISVTVSGGKVTGDTGRVDVALGARLRITVTADVADELHVHGYDVSQQLSPNAPASIEFVADKAGVYLVELERAKLALTRIQVA